MNKNNEVLRLIDIGAGYDSELILDALNLTVLKSQFVGILGSNGSGKTTLFKVIAGELTPLSGQIIYNGVNINLSPISERLSKGIIYLHQFPIVFPDLYAWENFLIWASVLPKAPCVLSKDGINNFLTNSLSLLEIKISFDKKVSDMSETELQVLEFTRCFLFNAELILVDEATSILDINISNKLLLFLKRFCKNGGSVLFISHRLNELKKYSEVIYDLRDHTLLLHSLDIKPELSKKQIKLVPKTKGGYYQETVLNSDVLLSDGQSKLNLNLSAGEVLGITGLDGSEFEHFSKNLLKHIKNLKKETTNKGYRIGHDFAYLGKNREADWTFPLQSIEFNLTIGNIRQTFIPPNITADSAKQIEYFGIFPPEPDKLIDVLSGGNKLKTAFGRTLLFKCPFNILDEPFTGIDSNSRSSLIQIIETEANKGFAFVIFSKEYHELIKFCNSIIAFNNAGSYKQFEASALDNIAGDELEVKLFN